MSGTGAVAALLFLLSVSIAAQPSLPQGTRVRVFTTGTPARADEPGNHEAHVGTLVASTPTNIVIDTGSLTHRVTIAVGDVRRIDVSRGASDRRWSGAVIGGLISGGAFVALACAFSDGSCKIGNNVGGFVAYYAVGAIPGALVGGAIGSRQRGPERWERVWASPALRFGLRLQLQH